MMAGRGGRGGGRGGFQAAEGDWPCPNPGCSNINFARRDKCNRCHTARPEGAGGAAKPAASLDFRGPPGLFQAGDWTCNTCGNVNWERRNECNICKSSKPGMPGLDEKRDGAGGGFNERQDRVASAKAEIAEDGYDDFGMKKKNVKASKAEREAAALARLHQSYSAIYQSSDAKAPAARTSSRHEPPPSFDKIEKVSRPVSPPPAAPRDGKRRRSRSPERGRRDVKRSRSRDRQRRSPVRDRDRGRDQDSNQRRRSRSRSRDRGHRDNRRR